MGELLDDRTCDPDPDPDPDDAADAVDAAVGPVAKGTELGLARLNNEDLGGAVYAAVVDGDDAAGTKAGAVSEALLLACGG